ncbi:hypothetical protein [Bacillus sp. JJ722]|uniref:hypothetical protein n=1 Tax=Bacillus sp. JJ722 TaxID=3122973 RepID=UPI0030005471
MFKVKRFDNDKVVYTVYATQETPFGVLMFLVFTLGKWMWIPADEFVPIDYED